MKANAECRYSMHALYHLELIEESTGTVKQVVDCENVVLNFWTNSAKEGQFYPPKNIAVGTGVGTPSAADTGLFQLLWKSYEGSVTRTLVKTYPTATRTLQVTIPASEAIGALTECGLQYDYNYNYTLTHAMFTDSEGNPIVINKTALDILTITVTVQYAFTFTPSAQEGVSVFLDNTETNFFYRLLLSEVGTYNGAEFQLLPNKRIPNSPNSPVVTSRQPYTGAVVDGVYTTNFTVLYSETTTYNGGLGFDVNAIHIPGIGTFNMTEDIFPPTPFPKYQVGVGDGTNKGFNIKTPSCKAGTQKVYVNSVLQTEGVDYTFYPHNKKDFITEQEGWREVDATFTLVYKGYNMETYGPFYPKRSVQSGTTALITPTTPIVFDLHVAKEINRVWLPGLSGTNYVGVRFEYSTDGVVWNLAKVIATEHATAGYMDFDPITARYWRYASLEATYQHLHYGEPITFGYYRPSILFTTAPANNSVVEIEYDLQVPFKNNMHSLTMNFTFEYSVW